MPKDILMVFGEVSIVIQYDIVQLRDIRNPASGCVIPKLKTRAW